MGTSKIYRYKISKNILQGWITSTKLHQFLLWNHCSSLLLNSFWPNHLFYSTIWNVWRGLSCQWEGKEIPKAKKRGEDLRDRIRKGERGLEESMFLARALELQAVGLSSTVRLWSLAKVRWLSNGKNKGVLITDTTGKLLCSTFLQAMRY